MSKKQLKKLILIIKLTYCCIILLCSKAYSQQTIFNVPSADVTPQYVFYTENENQFRSWDPHYYILTQYNNFGIGHNTDIEASLYNVRTPKNKPTMGYGFKSVIPILKDKYPERAYKMTIGDQVLVTYNENSVGNWGYTHLSGIVPVSNTRLTAGVSAGSKQYYGKNVVCFIGGYEQPISKKFSIIGDWYSGGHLNGFFIPGFSYKLTKYNTLYIGYRIRNNKNSPPSGFVIEINAFIPIKDKK